MVILQIILIVLAALIIGSLFYFVFKSTGPWGSFWIFFLVLLLAGLAAEAWITPIGPVYWDIAWGPVLFVIFLFALLMVAAAPPRPGGGIYRPENIEGTRETDTAVIALSIFFWVFLLFLFGAVLYGLLS